MLFCFEENMPRPQEIWQFTYGWRTSRMLIAVHERTSAHCHILVTGMLKYHSRLQLYFIINWVILVCIIRPRHPALTPYIYLY